MKNPPVSPAYVSPAYVSPAYVGPIAGTLTSAGTFATGSEPATPGLFISMTIEDLRAVEFLPLYQPVVIIKASAWSALQDYLRDLRADNAEHRLAAVTAQREATELMAILREKVSENDAARHSKAEQDKAEQNG